MELSDGGYEVGVVEAGFGKGSPYVTCCAKDLYLTSVSSDLHVTMLNHPSLRLFLGRK